MTCNNIQSLLSSYLDQELSSGEMFAVRRHLQNCADCAEEFEAISVVKRMIGEAPVPEPSADFEDRLVASVMAKVQPAPKKISLISLTGFAAASMAATFLILQLAASKKAEAAPTDAQAYQFIQRDRALSASNDPLSGSTVMPVTYDFGR